MKVRIFARAVWTATVVFALGSCTSITGQKEFEREALQLPANYTRTSALGTVELSDTDDWRISPLYEQLVFVNPPFPNPTRGQQLTWEFRITGSPGLQTIQVFAFNALGRRFLTAFQVSGDSFFEVIQLNPIVFSSTTLLSDAAGLHRVLFYDQLGRIITYGDILVDL